MATSHFPLSTISPFILAILDRSYSIQKSKMLSKFIINIIFSAILHFFVLSIDTIEINLIDSRLRTRFFSERRSSIYIPLLGEYTWVHASMRRRINYHWDSNNNPWNAHLWIPIKYPFTMLMKARVTEA